MTVTDDEMHVRIAACRDYVVALGERQRHGLLDEQMLAMRGRDSRMPSMELMRTREVERIDVGAARERFDIVESGRVEVRPELGAGVSRGSHSPGEYDRSGPSQADGIEAP